MTKRVLVVTPFHETGMSMLRGHAGVTLDFSEDTSEDAILERAAAASAIVVRNGFITRRIIEAAPLLEVVSRTGVGVDNVDVAALTERGIPVTITPGANATSVAEHAMYLLLALAKQGRWHQRAVEEGRFERRFEMRARDIEGRSLLIIGFGRIGTRLAPRALAFGMRVHVHDPYVEPAEVRAAGCVPEPNLRAALERADAVSVHCPLNAETRHLISTRELAALPAHAWLINTARGGIVDEEALVAALEAGRLAGAGLDVFAEEPPPPDHPLLGMPSVVLSPHNAGVSLEAAERAGIAVATNTLAALFGTLDPASVFNPEVLGSGRAGV